MSPSKPLGRLRAWLAHLALAATTAATAQQSPETSAPKSKDEVIELSPFTVNASADIGYGSLENTSGRLAKAYQDVPQMANVVTSELLGDMKRLDTVDALTFVPGASLDGNLFPAIKLRGLATSSQFIDGFLGPGFANGTTTDIAFTDRVEVIKGPAPGSFGRGDPAGFINYVIKSPTFHRSTDVDVLVGTGNRDTISQRYMIDDNGLLTDDGKTAYRVVAVSSKGANTPTHSEYEHNSVLVALQRNFTGGSLSVKTTVSNDKLPGTDTPSFMIDKDYHRVWNEFQHELGNTEFQYNLLDPNTLLAFDSTGVSSRLVSTTAVLDYKLGQHWSTRQAVNFLQSTGYADTLLNGNLEYGPDGTILSDPLRLLYWADYRTTAYQSDFVGNYKIPAIDCSLEILGGGDYSFAVTKYAVDTQLPDPQPLESWNSHVPQPPSTINPDSSYDRQAQTDWSAYVQLEAKFWHDRLRFTASGRKNFSDLKDKSTVTNTRFESKTHSPMLPAYSVLFKINDELSFYALYSQYIEAPSYLLTYNAVPTSDPRSQERALFQPSTDLKEIGFKGNMLSGRFGFSVCAYSLTSNGEPLSVTIFDNSSTNPNGVISHLIPSSSDAKGLEFECFGKLSKNLTFMLNGSYILSSHTLGVFTRVDGLTSTFTNRPFTNDPNTLAGYATYSFTGNRRRGLALTAGVKTIFSGWQMLQGSLYDHPYPKTNSILDLGATYGLNDRWEFYIKGNNVLERTLVQTAENGYVYGRKILAGVTLHF